VTLPGNSNKSSSRCTREHQTYLSLLSNCHTFKKKDKSPMLFKYNFFIRACQHIFYLLHTHQFLGIQIQAANLLLLFELTKIIIIIFYFQ
jgi:hypothetical protein